MRKVLSVLLVLLMIVALVSCELGLEDPQDDNQTPSGQDDNGGDPGQGGEQPPEVTYQVTFIQEGLDPIIETYHEGDPLWLHAPVLATHNILGYYYNWDEELDTQVTSDMTVTRTENEGHAVFFMNVDEHEIKIIGKNYPEDWTTLAVADFPAPPAIEGFEGIWDQDGDIRYFSSARMDIICWYKSTETFVSTELPKSYIFNNGTSGRVAFTISEYPVFVSGGTMTYINDVNFPSASSGLTTVTSGEAASVIDVTRGEMTDTYAAYSFKEQTDYLIANVPTIGFVNAIKVMRQQTGDNSWSVPNASNLGYVYRVLREQEGLDSFFSYLSAGVDKVKSINSEEFFLYGGSSRRMRYTMIESYGPVWAQWNFGGGDFSGYLWPIKPITVE